MKWIKTQNKKQLLCWKLTDSLKHFDFDWVKLDIWKWKKNGVTQGARRTLWKWAKPLYSGGSPGIPGWPNLKKIFLYMVD